MGRIQFTGKAEDATVGGGGGGNFEPAPRGFYTLQIADYSQNQRTVGGKYPGTPITKFVCEIADEGEHFGKKVWHNVTWIPRGKGEKPQGGHGMAVHFLHAVGMAANGDEFDFDEAEFQGKTFRVLLEVEPYDKVVNGRTFTNHKNAVREIYSENHPEPAELPPPKPKTAKAKLEAPAKGNDMELEEVPF